MIGRKKLRYASFLVQYYHGLDAKHHGDTLQAHRDISKMGKSSFECIYLTNPNHQCFLNFTSRDKVLNINVLRQHGRYVYIPGGSFLSTWCKHRVTYCQSWSLAVMGRFHPLE